MLVWGYATFLLTAVRRPVPVGGTCTVPPVGLQRSHPRDFDGSRLSARCLCFVCPVLFGDSSRRAARGIPGGRLSQRSRAPSRGWYFFVPPTGFSRFRPRDAPVVRRALCFCLPAFYFRRGLLGLRAEFLGTAFPPGARSLNPV